MLAERKLGNRTECTRGDTRGIRTECKSFWELGPFACLDSDASDSVLREQVLGLDYDTEVAPKLDALQQSLGCDAAALSAEVLRKPSATGIEVRGAAKRRAGG